MIPLLKAENLKLHYLAENGGRLHIVDGISFEISKGEIIAIAGEPGCGKTALAYGLTGTFYKPLFYTSGDLRFEGTSLIGMHPQVLHQEILGKKISLIPQNSSKALPPYKRIAEFATDVLLAHYPKLSKSEALERIQERFNRIGLNKTPCLNHYPHQLSKETSHRVIIAIATLLNPKVVIADDPTQSLDLASQRLIIELLLQLVDQEVISSLVFISSNIPILKHLATRMAVFHAVEFVEYGTAQQVISDPRHPYSQALIASMTPPEEHTHIGPQFLDGPAPSIQFPPQGCRFATRCIKAKPDCTPIRQMIRTVGDRDVRCMYAE